MSNQIDVGWTSPPFAVDLLREGKIRQIMRASAVPELRNQTARFMTANALAIESRRAVFVRYLQAYREAVDAERKADRDRDDGHADGEAHAKAPPLPCHALALGERPLQGVDAPLELDLARMVSEAWQQRHDGWTLKNPADSA